EFRRILRKAYGTCSPASHEERITHADTMAPLRHGEFEYIQNQGWSGSVRSYTLRLKIPALPAQLGNGSAQAPFPGDDALRCSARLPWCRRHSRTPNKDRWAS